MKIAVMGSGALGSLYGGLLSEKNEVCLISRRREHIEAINNNGLYIEEGENTLHFFPEATTDPKEAGERDLIILSVKAGATRGALLDIGCITRPDTLVFSIQNGYGNHRVMGEFLSPEQIIVGTSAHGALYKAPGIIAHTGRGQTSLGSLAGDPDTSGKIAGILEEAGFETRIYENVLEAVWKKLFGNIGLNALSAIFREPNGYINTDKGARRAAKQLVREAVEVANRVDGMHFDPDQEVRSMFELTKATATNRSSMLSDVENKRPTEIDYINKAVADLAVEHGISAPGNELVANIIKGIEGIYTNPLEKGI